jgi:transposase
MLKEPGRAATSKSYMWVRRGGPPSRPIILFDYDQSRSGAVPFRLLADIKGTVQTDVMKAMRRRLRVTISFMLAVWRTHAASSTKQ